MIQQLWDKAWTEYADGIDLTRARVGGRATKENPNKEPFIFSDIDIVFYKPILPTLYKLIQNKLNVK